MNLESADILREQRGEWTISNMRVDKENIITQHSMN